LNECLLVHGVVMVDQCGHYQPKGDWLGLGVSSCSTFSRWSVSTVKTAVPRWQHN